MKCLDRTHLKPLCARLMSVNDPALWLQASKARIASWRKLTTRKGREKTGRMIVEGVRLVSEALMAGCPVEVLLCGDTAEGMDAVRRVVDLAAGWTGNTARVPRQDFRGLSDTVHGAGVAAVVRWQPDNWAPGTVGKRHRILFCDAVSDPGNLGTLIRTAAGLGLDEVVIGPDCVEVTNPKTMRATAGAVFRVPVRLATAIDSFADWCREHRFPIIVADAGGGEAGRPATQPRTSTRWVLVVGSEARGISPAWDAAGVRRVWIPMRRGVESLNASVAGAIIMDRMCRHG